MFSARTREQQRHPPVDDLAGPSCPRPTASNRHLSGIRRILRTVPAMVSSAARRPSERVPKIAHPSFYSTVVQVDGAYDYAVMVSCERLVLKDMAHIRC